MTQQAYQIVVTGELVDGTYLPEVKAKLATLFKTPAEKLDPLFSGNRVVIKKGLAAEAAEKYVAAVQAAGLICRAEEIGAEAPPTSTADTASHMSMAPVGTTIIDQPTVSAPEIDVSAYTMAPVGETLVAPPEIIEADIDVSALSMGSIGEVLVEYAPPETPVIDTSDLSVAPAGTQLADEKKATPAAIDTGNLNMAPVGSDVGEKKREEGPPPPDTSHLKLD
jgi:hypothetical protein